MDNQDLVKMIQNLNDKIDSMQKSEFHIHIDKVTVEHLQLEELAYHLDKIDIKELSGMMNLGNSFSPNIESVKSTSKNQQKKKDNTETDKSNHNDPQEINRDKPILSVVINGKEILSD
jgi:hypothetical protein